MPTVVTRKSPDGCTSPSATTLVAAAAGLAGLRGVAEGQGAARRHGEAARRRVAGGAEGRGRGPGVAHYSVAGEEAAVRFRLGEVEADGGVRVLEVEAPLLLLREQPQHHARPLAPQQSIDMRQLDVLPLTDTVGELRAVTRWKKKGGR